MNEPNYFSYLPANVRYDKRINDSCKLLFSEITCLCNYEGYCWATDAYFAELYGVSTRTIGRWIKKLCDCQFIERVVIYGEKGEIVGRRLFLFEAVQRGVDKNVDRGVDKNVNYNNKKKENNIKEMNKIDDDDYLLARVREEETVFDGEDEPVNLELWLKQHVTDIKQPSVYLLVNKFINGNTDVLNYVVKVLDRMYRSNKGVFVKNVFYSSEQVREYIDNLSQDVLSRICRGFYSYDEESGSRRRKDVSDPVAYIITALKNDKNKPLRKVKI